MYIVVKTGAVYIILDVWQVYRAAGRAGRCTGEQQPVSGPAANGPAGSSGPPPALGNRENPAAGENLLLLFVPCIQKRGVAGVASQGRLGPGLDGSMTKANYAASFAADQNMCAYR